jgi:hypothetical protein
MHEPGEQLYPPGGSLMQPQCSAPVMAPAPRFPLVHRKDACLRILFPLTPIPESNYV